MPNACSGADNHKGLLYHVCSNDCACTTALGRQPIHVQDFAELAMQEADAADAHRIVNATGPETYTFRELSRRALLPSK